MIPFDKLWETMRKKGISTYTLREKHNIDSRTIRRLKANQNTTTDTLNTPFAGFLVASFMTLRSI